MASIWQSSRIRSVYRPRASLDKVFRQYLQYGYWKPFVMKKHGQPASLRHVVPAVFVMALLATAVIAFGGIAAWPAMALIASYAAAVVVLTWLVARAAKERAPVVARIPLVIVTYHVAYGIGSLLGALDVLVRRRGRDRFASLTR